jgi:hypothetical protein
MLYLYLLDSHEGREVRRFAIMYMILILLLVLLR